MTIDYLTSVLHVHIYIILTMNCFPHVSSFCRAPCPHLHVILFYQLIVSCIIQVFAYGQKPQMLSFNVTRVHVLYESLFRTAPYSSHLLSQSYSALKYKVYNYATSITLKLFSLFNAGLSQQQQETDWKT